MIEFITLTILSILAIAIFRPGKTPPLNNPLTIERPGLYRMSLAPQLNLAQPFIETLAKALLESSACATLESTVWFEVMDKDVAAHGQASYLLSIARNDGLLNFTAVLPENAPTTTKNLSQNNTNESALIAIIETVAAQRKITATALANH